MFRIKNTIFKDSFLAIFPVKKVIWPGDFATTMYVLLLILLVFFHLSSVTAQNFRSASGASSQTNSVTIQKPTGTVYGDVMIAAVGFRPEVSIISAPVGWTLIRRTNQPSGAPNAQTIYWKAAGENEPDAYEWTFDTSTGSVAGILSFYDVNPFTPIHVEDGQATPGGLSHSTPAVTTTVNNAMLITSHSFGSCATWSPPSGMTEAIDIANLAVPNAGGISMEVNYAVQGTAGISGTKTATASWDHDAGVSHIIALLPRSSTFNAYQTGNWSNKTSWATNRFGAVTTSTGSTQVSGSGTLFTQDLVAGDLLLNSDYNLIGTVTSIESNTSLTLSGNALLGLSGAAYKASAHPQTWDNVYIGTAYGTTAVTTTVDVTEATCSSLTFESSNAAIEYKVDIPSGNSLQVKGAAFLRLPSKANALNTINVSGTLTAGSLTLEAVTTGAGRISQLTIAGGTANISGDILFSTNENSKVNATGAGRLNIGGNFLEYISETTPPTSFATSATLNFESTATLNFNGTDKQQCLLAHGTYGNVYCNNSGNNVATLNSAITNLNVTGDVRIQSGIFTNQGASGISTLNAASSGFGISGNAGKTFELANEAFLRLGGTTTLPEGFGTITLQPTSTTDYIGGDQTVTAQNFGNLTISPGPSARTLTFAGTGTVGIFSTFSASQVNNTYDFTGGTIAFNGNLPQALPAGLPALNNLTLNNSASADALTLSGPTTVNGTLTLTNGLLLTSTTNTLSMGSAASIVLNAPVSQDNSFVKGPMVHTVSTSSAVTKIFPVGKGTQMHRADLTVSHVDATSTMFTGEFFESSAAALGYTLPSTIDRVSSVSYWDIHKGAGASITTSASVKLYYRASDDVSDPENLRMVKDDGAGNWLDIGGKGTGAPSGSITSTVDFTSFSDFSLANNSGGTNTLPVSLLNFKATANGTAVDLSWQTASELNNHFFTIEKSRDSKTFDPLTIIQGAGNSNEIKSYQTIDNNPYRTTYYRLKQTDFDGKTSWSGPIQIYMKTDLKMEIYPNPVLSGEPIRMSFPGLLAEESIQMELSDMQGKVLHTQTLADLLSGSYAYLEYPGKLAPGLYFITAKTEGKILRQRLMLK